MLRRLLTHPLFAPGLMVAIFGLGALTVGFLMVGPGLGAWADTLLTSCFGWNAETRRYRLDSLVLTLLQPPLFATVVFFFYAEELRAFLSRRGGRLMAMAAPAAFVALGASLLVTSEISASGVPAGTGGPVSPVRQSARAPGFALVDHRGETVSLEGLRGRPVALTFFYGNCHESCPILLQRLKTLEARVGAGATFAAITLDPERDNQSALAMAASHWELGERWHLLGGDAEAVRATIRAYGVQWARRPDGEIAHENVIVLIDARGRLAYTYRGLAHAEDRQAADLARLAAERA